MKVYLRRRGRLTRGQQRALEDYGPERIVAAGSRGPIDWASRFSRTAPLGVEIGFGMGHALLDWGSGAPDWNLVGLEVYQPGIGALLMGSQERELTNLLVVEDDANETLQELFEPESIQEIRIFFPDPWPKRRHHERRLIQPAFADLLGSRLARGGRLRLATDWEDYAAWMLKVLEAEPRLQNEAGSGFAARPDSRPVTRFEARGQRLGHGVWDLAYLKVA